MMKFNIPIPYSLAEQMMQDQYDYDAAQAAHDRAQRAWARARHKAPAVQQKARQRAGTAQSKLNLAAQQLVQTEQLILREAKSRIETHLK